MSTSATQQSGGDASGAGSDSNAAAGSSADQAGWGPDILGGSWQARTIPLRPDASGTPVATLVRQLARPPADAPVVTPPTPAPAVLYLHGFSDYFFQAEHAAAWVQRGYDFYALDMRDHGRSIRAGRRAGWIESIPVHVEEISAALRIIRAGGERPVVLVGHSTGGLIACLYADRNPGSVDAVVLNSPWFDLHRPPLLRAVARPLITALGRLAPCLTVSHLGDSYGRSLHISTGGEFAFDLDLKPLPGFPVRAGWLASVIAAQRHVRRGLAITVPVLLCSSDTSGSPTRPTAAQLAGSDVLLGVADMHRHANRLGTSVDVHVVAGGRHDLALSAQSARTAYTRFVLDWTSARIGWQRSLPAASMIHSEASTRCNQPSRDEGR